MIAGLWAGDGQSRRAVVGNWLELPLGPASIGAVIGDGSLSAVGMRVSRIALLREIARVLKPGARAAVRLFACPAVPETLECIVAEARSGVIENFHVLKWRVAMACATREPDWSIAVRKIRDAINDAFPDRDHLVELTGWDVETIDAIDAYRDSAMFYCFPTAADLVTEAEPFFKEVQLRPSGEYPLAQACPLLVLSGPVGT